MKYNGAKYIVEDISDTFSLMMFSVIHVILIISQAWSCPKKYIKLLMLFI